MRSHLGDEAVDIEIPPFDPQQIEPVSSILQYDTDSQHSNYKPTRTSVSATSTVC